MTTLVLDEDARAGRLRDVQQRAKTLFDDILNLGLICPGVKESQVSAEIATLASERYGVEKHRLNRVIRSGPNTTAPLRAESPDRVIAQDDIVYIDLGPVFADWQADFGKTFVLGGDRKKIALCHAVEEVYYRTKTIFSADPKMTGAQVYETVAAFASELGYRFEAEIAGHVAGEFTHAAVAADHDRIYITPSNTRPLRGLDEFGRRKHWILEITLTDPKRNVAAFYEDLLTV